MSTTQAIGRLSRHLGISGQSFSFAGLKDTKAITAQAVHLPRDRISVPSVVIDGVRLMDPRPARARLRTGDHWGNYFRLRVFPARDRDVFRQSELDRMRAQLTQEGLTNYFDHQRFGRRLNLHWVGELLVNGHDDAAMEEFVAGESSLEPREVTECRRRAQELWPKHDAILGLFQGRSRRSLDQEIDVLQAVLSGTEAEPMWSRAIVAPFAVRAWVAYLFNRALSRPGIRSVSEVPLFDARPSTVRFYSQMVGSDELPEVISPKALPHLASGSRPSVAWPVDCHFRIDGQAAALSFGLQKGVYATSLLRSVFDPHAADTARITLRPRSSGPGPEPVLAQTAQA